MKTPVVALLILIVFAACAAAHGQSLSRVVLNDNGFLSHVDFDGGGSVVRVSGAGQVIVWDGNMHLSRDGQGRVREVASTTLLYDGYGRLRSVGGVSIQYNGYGQVVLIGGKSFHYSGGKLSGSSGDLQGATLVVLGPGAAPTSGAPAVQQPQGLPTNTIQTTNTPLKSAGGFELPARQQPASAPTAAPQLASLHPVRQSGGLIQDVRVGGHGGDRAIEVTVTAVRPLTAGMTLRLMSRSQQSQSWRVVHQWNDLGALAGGASATRVFALASDPSAAQYLDSGTTLRAALTGAGGRVLSIFEATLP